MAFLSEMHERHDYFAVTPEGVLEHVGDLGNSSLYSIQEDNELADLLEKVIGAAAKKEHEWIIEQRDE